MTPNCTGLMPQAVATGSRIGVMMTISGAISMTAPRKSSSRFIASRMMTGLSLMLSTPCVMSAGTLRKAIIQPKAPAAAMRLNTIAMVLTVFMSTPGIMLSFSSR